MLSVGAACTTPHEKRISLTFLNNSCQIRNKLDSLKARVIGIVEIGQNGHIPVIQPNLFLALNEAFFVRKWGLKLDRDKCR